MRTSSAAMVGFHLFRPFLCKVSMSTPLAYFLRPPENHSDLYLFDFVMKATSMPVNTNQAIMHHTNTAFLNSGLKPDIRKMPLATKNTHPIFLLSSSMRILFFSSFGMSRQALIQFGPTPMKKTIPTARKISPKTTQFKFIRFTLLYYAVAWGMAEKGHKKTIAIMLLQRIIRNLFSANFFAYNGNAAYRGIHKRWTNYMDQWIEISALFQ
ncbi:hypothetical protein [Sporomusa sphaeroides]|uniref:hypothetical protein n=1 Tax=Sporomusa sphaeroides TaxID=47679 RepID=UPI002BD36080|nr:hypothetical protein [Sporomusa sphaeroides]HML33345.1 hypothetical protein [Sporomusa sphaeroides]